MGASFCGRLYRDPADFDRKKRQPDGGIPVHLLACLPDLDRLAIHFELAAAMPFDAGAEQGPVGDAFDFEIGRGGGGFHDQSKN